ncbi:MAG: glycosyltransferase [Planctomycetes bacterium]|nr:glycosyltransferase [Planctomycetota bacterium]
MPDPFPELPAGRKLRVAFVTTSMIVGGQERVVMDVCNGMDRDRFEVALLLTKDRGPLCDFIEEPRTEVVDQFRNGPLGSLLALNRLTRWMKKWKPDCVFTVGLGDKFLLGRLAAKCAKTQVILSSLHCTPGPEHIGRTILGKWNKKFMHLNSGVVTVTDDLANYLQEHENYPREKTHVIPNGVDCERFYPHDPPQALRDELGIRPEHRVASIIAALRPEKRHDLFLQAARQVVERLPSARFLIVGDGPSKSDFELLAGDLGLDKHVQFLGSRHDIPAIQALSDVVCLASTDVESAPICMLEALASGRPQVATSIGGIPKIVADGKTGYLAPPGEVPALAQAITRILTDDKLAAQMREASRSRALQQFSVAFMVRAHERLIEDLYEAA